MKYYLILPRTKVKLALSPQLKPFREKVCKF